jgi:hypothetical protein
LTGEARGLRIAFPELGPDQLLAWRFGMAQLAPFVATLTSDARDAMVQRARSLLHDVDLIRSIIVIVAAA